VCVNAVIFSSQLTSKLMLVSHHSVCQQSGSMGTPHLQLINKLLLYLNQMRRNFSIKGGEIKDFMMEYTCNQGASFNIYCSGPGD
jgi:hypothetical protein